MFPLAFDAGWLQGHWWGFTSRNYVVWPTFLMNVFIALKGSHFWFLFGSLATHWAHSEDSDQTGRMPRLIWVFAGRTCHFAGFVMRRHKCPCNWSVQGNFMHDVSVSFLTLWRHFWRQFSEKRFDVNIAGMSRTEQFSTANWNILATNAYSSWKYNCRRKSIQEKKIHNCCLVRIENSVTRDNCYPSDGIFSPHLTTI